MSAGTTLYTMLATVGTTHPHPLPEGVTLPAVSYQLTSTRRLRTQDGGVVLKTRWWVNCWGNSPTAADTLAESVTASLERYKAAGVRMTLVQGDHELLDPEPGVHRRVLDVELST